MKRIIAIISILPFVFIVAAAGGFADVADTAWYYESVQYAASEGIVSGRGGGIFDPEGTLSIAEAVKLAAVIHARQNASEPPQESGKLWHDAYFDYALEHGILPVRPENPDKPVTRALFVQYIYAASGALIARNNIAAGDIRDVASGSDCEAAVYAFYTAGVLTGADEFGRFFPERTLTRAEACGIIMRVLLPQARKYVNLSGELSSEDVFMLCSGAVFSIETFDKKGNSIRTGSGFFITSDGLAGTNLHVLEKAHTAMITTTDGSVYEVLGVAAYSAESNVAIMRIDGDGFEWLPLKTSDEAKAGQTVYSIGNPLGLDGTISKGIISYVGRESGGRNFLQFTASISQGSGGGALVDSYGYVVGITSSSYTAGSSLNLATPSKSLIELSLGDLTQLSDIIHADSY